MKHVALLNLCAVFAAVGLAMAAAGRAAPAEVATAKAPAATTPVVQLVALPSGEKALADRRGRAVPLRDYRRILSASSVSDQLVLALAERERVVAITEYGKKNALTEQASAGIPTHGGLGSIEAILSFKPDLILTNHFGDAAALERIEERGVPVFDLGEMRGLSTLVPNIHVVAALVNRPEAGRTLAEQFTRRFASVSRGDKDAGRCMYLSVYGGQIFGGTTGSSYHDVIGAAGLTDAAASKYHDWPNYAVEDVLALDPDFVLTSNGLAETVCRQPGFAGLRVCADQRRIFMLPNALIGDAGLRMLEAAEALRSQVEAFHASRAP